MRYIKLYEDYRQFILTKEDINMFHEEVTKRFNGLGLTIDITYKEKAGYIQGWLEVIIGMDLLAIPNSLLCVLCNYMEQSTEFVDRETAYLKLVKNKSKYGRAKGLGERMQCFKLLFSSYHSVEKLVDEDNWFLFRPTNAKEAINTTIREFTNLINSCDNDIYRLDSGYSGLFGIDEKIKKNNGLRHFIIGYLNRTLKTYDYKNILKSINDYTNSPYYHKLLNYQKIINPEIYKLIEINKNDINDLKDMDDIGFFD